MSQQLVYLDTDGIITLSGVTLQPANTPVTGATVVGTLYDPSGNPVANWNGFSFTDEGSGNYQAAFTAANVPASGTYSLKIVVTKSGLTLQMFTQVIVGPLDI